ncbi:internal virion protein [Xanthomonas phage MUD8-T1]|uniref:Internal virion protein n=1 Tax=Xanthomonas phage MUD8-T1 TaxID=2886033 RepID=A0AAE9C901_9CAUD|nr:internal virion protein [Xanthomonas phage MUD8-T1]
MADIGTVTFNTQSALQGGINATPALSGNTSIQGAGVNQVGPVQSGSDWFASTGGMTMPDSNLPEFLQELAAPNTAKLKQQQMWDGFVAARAGKTMDEIAATEPWYKKIFGDTNYEIGASMYNTLSQVNEMESDLLRRMPELRQLPPEAMAKEFNDLATARMTGNGFADTVLQKTFMDRAGSLMDLHTKERTAWQQQELVKAQYAANSSASTGFNELAKRTAMLGTNRPMDEKATEALTQAQLSLLDGLSPSRYQTDESYKSAITAFYRGAADRGEFHTLKFLNSKGVLNAIDPDGQLGIQQYVKQAQDRYRSDWLDANPEQAEKMALVSMYAAEGIGAKPSQAMIEEMNSTYAAETGSDAPLYSGTQLASIMAQSAGAHIRAQEAVINQRNQAAKAALTDQQKLAAQEEDIRGGIEAFKRGTYAQTINIPGVDKELIEANTVQAWNATMAANPKVAMSQLVWNANTGRGAVLKGVADQFQTTARAVLRDQPNTAAAALYQQWKELKQTTAARIDTNGQPVQGRLTGATTAALYFGDSVNTFFNKLQALENGGVNFELAYEVARGEITTDDPTQFDANSRKESEATQARVTEAIAKLNPKYLGMFGNKLGDSGRAAYARAIVRSVTDTGGLLDTSAEGLQAAATHAKLAYGLEDAGKYAWENGRDDEGRVIGGVGVWLGFMDTKETGPAIEKAIDAALRRVNIEPSTGLKADVFRMKDSENGEPVLYVNAVGEKGWKVVPVYGRDIKAEYEKHTKQQRQLQAPVPQGYVRMNDGTIQQSISIQPKL